MQIYNRKTKNIEIDSQYGEKYLNFLYTSVFGRLLLKVVISPVFSKINGAYNNTFLSKNKIAKFIKKYKININEYEKNEYKSFNDFFTRKKINLEVNKGESYFISPADSKLLVYEIKKDLIINIKNNDYTLNELLGEEFDLNDFTNGMCLVFRLSMDNYHRYCYIDDGITEGVKFIRGKLHTVSSISSEHKIYCQNSRICNFLETKNFGKIICVEVGALLVGKIKNKNLTQYTKGMEKGYFELGGSTIVILVKSIIKIDQDILEKSKEDIETIVSYGERIGELR